MRLFGACAVTVAVETLFFAVAGMSRPVFILLCVLANIATNLSANLLMGQLASFVNLTWFVYVVEAAVVGIEYFVYACEEGRSAKLFLLTLTANILSYCIGLMLYGHV